MEGITYNSNQELSNLAKGVNLKLSWVFLCFVHVCLLVEQGGRGQEFKCQSNNNHNRGTSHGVKAVIFHLSYT